jgi:hypothetical protein
VRVESRDRQAFEVRSVDAPDGIEVRWDSEAGPSWSIQLQVDVRDEALVGRRAFATIHTDRPGQPVVKLPIVRAEDSG